MKLRDFLLEHRLSRYSLPALVLIVVIDVLLGATGILSMEQMKAILWIPVSLEIIVMCVCLLNITRIIRRYRVLKGEGREAMDAFQEALEIVLSPRLARLAMMEPRLYHALYLSYRKRRKTDDGIEFSTRLESYGFLVSVLIGLCIIEILLVFFMLPVRVIWRVLHSIIGLWTILWLWADYRAMRLYPHQINAGGICFRIGLRCRQVIGWNVIASVSRTSKAAPGYGPVMPKEQPGCLYLAAGEPCNIEVELNQPALFQGMFSEIRNVSRLYLSIETPEAFIASAGQQSGRQ